MSENQSECKKDTNPSAKEEKNFHLYQTVLDENASIYNKEETKTEKQKLSEMTKDQKRQYFLDYYAFATLGVILAVAIVIFLIVHFATKKDMAFGILAVNTNGEEITATGPEYFESFLEENGVNPKKEEINVNYTIYIKADSEESIDQTNLQTIQTLFMTQSADVFFSDEDFFRCMAGTDYIADLRDYIPQEVLDQYSDQLIYEEDIITGETICAGVILHDNEWVKDTGWYEGGETCVGLADGMVNEDLAVKMLLDILGE